MRDEQFERLYEQHAQPLFGFLVYRTGDRVLAEDLLADTFERVYRSRASFSRRRGTEKAWLYTIALNLLRDHARRARAEERALEKVGARADGGTAPDAIAEHGDLMRALRGLADEEREAIALRYGAGLTVPEIAKLKGEKLTTAEGRVYRGLRKLRERLEG